MTGASAKNSSIPNGGCDRGRIGLSAFNAAAVGSRAHAPVNNTTPPAARAARNCRPLRFDIRRLSIECADVMAQFWSVRRGVTVSP